VFRSAIEKAGITLIVACKPLPEPVYVDRDMWEKIVLNLVSNAYKFTLEGEIKVSLRLQGGAATLRVRDTGLGISEDQLPHIFERFHRVEETRARTQEGTGIGLALVQQLVRLHGGTVQAESVYGQGTTITVEIPLGSAHLPSEAVGKAESLGSTALSAGHFVGEALKWMGPDDQADYSGSVAEDAADLPAATRDTAEVGRRRIILADDNSDMRSYLIRLLRPRYDVEAVPDGEAALRAVRENRPELVLTDVMMPRLDGFGLIKELRSQASTRTIPVIMLSARAGEEARIEGLHSGADDYLIKPFHARELIARVAAAIELARVRREAASANELAANTLERITDGFIALDPQWRFSHVNSEAQRMTGMERNQLVGKNYWELFPRAIGTIVEREFRRSLADQVAVQFETHYHPWERWFEVKAFPAPDGGLSVFFRDITDRKQAEEELRHQHARTSRLVESNIIGVVFAEDERITEANDAFLGMTGYSRADLEAGRLRWPDLTPPEHARNDHQRLQDLRVQGAVAPYQKECFRKDGRRVPILIGAEVIDPTTPSWVCFVQDMSRVKEVEQKLREADRRKDEFLAMLAHELRNPLAAISNAAQVARLSESIEHQEWSQVVIESQVQNLSRMIDDLLDVSRITRGKIQLRRQYIKLATIISCAVEAARPLLEERKHRLILDLTTEPLPVQGDPTRLEQVFVNLLNNAAKYTESEGLVTISARKDGGDVVVQVEDNGVGMSPELLSSAFDLFTQGDRTIARSEGGLGLGLTIVRNLVELHGGSVQAESQGQGSRLIVRLPLSTERLAAPARGQCPGVDSRKLGSKVLVVDDSLDTAHGLTRLLKLLGHDALMAHDGPSAIEEARSYRPDIILLDIGLPGMDGYQVARTLRDEGFDQTVIIAVSGYGEGTAQARSRASGFNHHLVKPVDLDSLVALIGKPG
jgi:PAS domain S-box-containing protein